MGISDDLSKKLVHLLIFKCSCFVRPDQGRSHIIYVNSYEVTNLTGFHTSVNDIF